MITGGMKFLGPSQFLFKDGATATHFNGQQANSILNHSRDNGWETVGSDDLTQENIIIDAALLERIDRIILNKHNFKDIKLFIFASPRTLNESGGSILAEQDPGELLAEDVFFEDLFFDRFTLNEAGFFILSEQDPNSKLRSERFSDFETASASEFTLNESGGKIVAEQDNGLLVREGFFDFGLGGNNPTQQLELIKTDLNESTTYFDFAPVRASRIILQVQETQIANQEKSLQSFIATTEIGTLEGFPQFNKRHDRNIRTSRAISGKFITQTGTSVLQLDLIFDNFSNQNDVDLIESLHNRDDDFLVWPGGGREGNQFFNPNILGFRLDDIFLMNVVAPLPLDYVNAVYVNPITARLNLAQVTG